MDDNQGGAPPDPDPPPPPQDDAGERLAGRLHQYATEYEEQVEADLVALESLESLDGADAAAAAAAAAAVLAAHIEQLQAYREEVERLLAAAVAERDACDLPDSPAELVADPEP